MNIEKLNADIIEFLERVKDQKLLSNAQAAEMMKLWSILKGNPNISCNTCSKVKTRAFNELKEYRERLIAQG